MCLLGVEGGEGEERPFMVRLRGAPVSVYKENKLLLSQPCDKFYRQSIVKEEMDFLLDSIFSTYSVKRIF